jgi:hypothetical protein
MLFLVNEHWAQLIELWANADEITKFLLNEHDIAIKRMFTSTSMLLLVIQHSMQLIYALGECRRYYKILIEHDFEKI